MTPARQLPVYCALKERTLALNRAPLDNAYLHNSIRGPSEPLLNHLLRSIAKADEIRVLVAFLLESGVRLIGPALRDADGAGFASRLALSVNY